MFRANIRRRLVSPELEQIKTGSGIKVTADASGNQFQNESASIKTSNKKIQYNDIKMVLSVYLSTVLIAIIGGFGLRWLLKRNRQLPPGPLGVPLLGYLPFLDIYHLGQSFAEIGRKYGDIFSLRVGTELAVVLNTHDAIKKAFTNDKLLDRPDTFMFQFFSQGNNGIASLSGEKWKVQRKFTHTQLKKFGFGRPQMEAFVQEEVQDLIQILKEKCGNNVGKSVEIGYDINVSIVNVIWSLVSGERKSHNDTRIRNFLESVNKSIELSTTSSILLFFPFLIKIFPERMFGIDQMRKWMKNSYGYLQEVIDSHKKQDRNEEAKDFIDAFLNEMEKDDAHPSFNELQLLVLCSELFGAGGEPTSATLKWAIRYLAMNPEIQKKAQEEIDVLLKGENRGVEMSDRPNLHYVQALIHDLIRLSDIHPIGVMHSPSEDIKIDDFVIPKGTFVFSNSHHVHHDPKYWEQPNELCPEHFLDAQGHFIPKREGFIAFGVGKRKCPGQDVAEMELFVFLTNLLKNFTFKLTPEDSGKVEASTGCVVAPKPYQIMLDVRS